MKKRSVIGVIVFPFLTLGIYMLYWFVSTKNELKEKGAEIPTAWLLIIPLVNIYWLWKYYEGAQQVTNEKVNGVLMFIINLLVTGIISAAICQDAYNNLTEQSSPVAPEQNPQPEIAQQQVGTPTEEVNTPPSAPVA